MPRPRPSKASDPVGRPSGRTPIDRLVNSRVGVLVMTVVPVPLAVARIWLHRDNARETAKDGWGRLRNASEQPRYDAVRKLVERYGPSGFVLDLGCSQGILQEGLTYERYLGVDTDPGSVVLASAKADALTAFVVGDGATFVPDAAPDVVVLNEMVYYLPDPVAAVRRYAALLAPGGVVVVSIFAHSWAARRLRRKLATELTLVESTRARSDHLAWDVGVYRCRTL